LLLVMQCSLSTRLLFALCCTAGAPYTEIPVKYQGWHY